MHKVQHLLSANNFSPYVSVSAGHTVKSDTSSFVSVLNPGSNISTHYVSMGTVSSLRKLSPMFPTNRQKALKYLDMYKIQERLDRWAQVNTRFSEQDKTSFSIEIKLLSSNMWQIYPKERIINVPFETELYFENIERSFPPWRKSECLWISNMNTVLCISSGHTNARSPFLLAAKHSVQKSLNLAERCHSTSTDNIFLGMTHKMSSNGNLVALGRFSVPLQVNSTPPTAWSSFAFSL